MLRKLWSECRYRFRAIFHRAAVERELQDEVQFHIAQETSKLERLGLSHADAIRKAHVAFGGVERIKDDTRDARGVEYADNLKRDIRLAMRSMRTRPGFAATVVTIIALGVGVNAAMFSVLDRALLRTPQFLADGGSVKRLYLTSTINGKRRTDRSFEYARYTDFKRWSRTISQFATFSYQGMAVGEGASVDELPVAIVSASFFDFFHLKPVAGRLFTVNDDVATPNDPVAVLGHSYWKSRYGSAASVVGTRIRIGKTTHAIIGVAPEGFDGIGDQQTPSVFIPLNAYAHGVDPGFERGYSWDFAQVIVRLRPGISVEAANTDLTNAYRQSWNAQRDIEPTTASVDIAKPIALAAPLQLGRGPNAGAESRVIVWIGGVALIVLLIAAANVANLLLARGFQRRQEFAVRRAIGGSRARLVQQLMTETVLLALIGGTLGALGATWADGALRTVFSDASIPAGYTDARMVVAAFAMTLLVAFLAALVPALYSGREDLTVSLRAGVRESAYRRSRTRSFLLVAQVTMSVILLIGAGLFVQSLNNVRKLRLGYDLERIALVRMNNREIAQTAEEMTLHGERLLEAARVIPGVRSVSPVVTTPFGMSMGRGFSVPGVDSVRKLGRFVLQAGSPEYFSTTGTRILRGRGFQAADGPDAPRVSVVSADMASAVWKGEDPIGKCMKFGKEPAPCTTVVGVAENIRSQSLVGAQEFMYYLPIAQYRALYGATTPTLFVRVDGDSKDFINTLRTNLQKVMPGAAYVEVRPMSDNLKYETQSWKFGATMFVALGGLALLLASVGLYAVVAFGVAQRSHEMSVRIALGARRKDLLQLVLGEGLGYIVAGVLLGAVIAAFVGNGLQRLLFQVSSHDPIIYGTVAAILLAVGAIACTWPATQVVRVNPNSVLRGE